MHKYCIFHQESPRSDGCPVMYHFKMHGEGKSLLKFPKKTTLFLISSMTCALLYSQNKKHDLHTFRYFIIIFYLIFVSIINFVPELHIKLYILIKLVTYFSYIYNLRFMIFHNLLDM